MYVCVCVCVCNLVGLSRCSVALHGCILCCDSVCDGLRGVVSWRCIVLWCDMLAWRCDMLLRAH